MSIAKVKDRPRARESGRDSRYCLSSGSALRSQHTLRPCALCALHYSVHNPLLICF